MSLKVTGKDYVYWISLIKARILERVRVHTLAII
jgi:hypothetical protein